jgi:hypothetical protein
MVEIDPTFVLAFQKSKVPNRPLALILHLSDFETFVPSIFQQQTRQNNKIWALILQSIVYPDPFTSTTCPDSKLLACNPIIVHVTFVSSSLLSEAAAASVCDMVTMCARAWNITENRSESSDGELRFWLSLSLARRICHGG